MIRLVNSSISWLTMMWYENIERPYAYSNQFLLRAVYR